MFVLFSEFCLLDKIRAGLLVASLSRTTISEVMSSISVDNDEDETVNVEENETVDGIAEIVDDEENYTFDDDDSTIDDVVEIVDDEQIQIFDDGEGKLGDEEDSALVVDDKDEARINSIVSVSLSVLAEAVVVIDSSLFHI